MIEKIKTLTVRYRQFIRFCIVGASNTLITLGVYQGLLFLSVPYLAASPVGYACGIFNGYLWSTAVVFHKKRDARNLIRFVAVNLAVLGLNTGLMYVWVDALLLHKFLAQLLTLCFTIPCNFILNKLWTFQDKGELAMKHISSPNAKTDPRTVCLTCNDAVDPAGVDTPVPRFSWQMASESPGQKQTAWRILVSASADGLQRDAGDVWDSGRVDGADSVGVPYGGAALSPRRIYHWKVCQWDRDGTCGPWSEAARFETGLMDKFMGQWIGSPHTLTPDAEDHVPAPMLRTAFTLPDGVRRGRIYLCGLGYHELYVNGVRVGDGLLSPGVSQYDRHVLYETFDVTGLLNSGENALGVLLGNGLFNCYTLDAWDFRYAPWRTRPRMWLEGHFELNDGREIVEVSGPHWRVATGPVVADGLRNGETYDARLERAGWAAPGFDSRDFLPVRVVRAPGGTRVSQQHPPIRALETLTAVAVRQTGEGEWVYDFGRNLSGFIHMEAPGFRDARVTIRYAERVDEKGRIDTANIAALIRSGEFQTDHYIMRGDPLEVWEPRFTYHGFRYAQITGYSGEHGPRIFKARVVHTDLPVRGEFSCSDPIINAIQQCARRSTLTNYHGIPTDCPHREKNGWTGDAQLSAEQTLLNFDPRAAYRKWFQDIRDAQRPDGSLPGIAPTGGWGFVWGNGPAWDSAVALIPWYQYLYTGDTVILEENYDAIVRYVDYLTGMEVGGIVDFGLGDWCPPGGNDNIKCPVAVTDTAYYHVCARLLSRIAAVLGREEDAAKYAALAGRIRDSFRREFVVVGDGSVTGGCQTSLACALHQGMIADEEREIFLASLLREIERCGRHIDCGTLGAKYVMHVLTDMDRTDVAFDIVTQKTYPSWANWIERGATTLWESWEGEWSQNHHMYSDVSAFFYRGLAGIRPDPDDPGFRHVILRPRPAGGLTWVNAWHEGPYGRIVSNWRIEQGVFIYNCTVPPGSRATLTLPSSEAVMPAIPGAMKDAAGRPTVALESGRHMFRCRI